MLAVAERWLRASDQIDDLIRRLLIPVDGIRPMRHKKTPILRSGLSCDMQQAIGQQLRAQYAVERPVPARLINLLKEFEQKSNKPAPRRHYASAT
jgi:hypothetical protein